MQRHRLWSTNLQFPLKPARCTWRSSSSVLLSTAYLFSTLPCKADSCKSRQWAPLGLQSGPDASLAGLRIVLSGMGCLCSAYCSPILHPTSKFRKCNIRLPAFTLFLCDSCGPSSCIRRKFCLLRSHAFLRSSVKFLWWRLVGRKILKSKRCLVFRCQSIFVKS